MRKIVDPKANAGTSIEAISDFFECYPAPQTAKAKLWELLIAAMGSNHADMWDSDTRAEMLFFFEQCGDLLDAVYEKMQSTCH